MSLVAKAAAQSSRSGDAHPRKLKTGLEEDFEEERGVENRNSDQLLNIEFAALFASGKVNECFDSLIAAGRVAEAALFARTYVPARANEAVRQWSAILDESAPKTFKFRPALLNEV